MSDEKPLKDARHNFWYGVANGSLFRCGMAFFSRDVIIPSYISELASKVNWIVSTSVIVSFATIAQRLGWRLPQFLVANRIETRKEKLPVYGAGASARVVALILLVLSLFIFGEGHPNLLLGLSLLFLSLFGLFGGVSGTAYMDIIGKAIPAKQRGKYYRNRNILGGVLVFIFSGPLITYIQKSTQDSSFLRSYSLIFICGIPLIALAFWLFSHIREPFEPPVKKRVSLKDHFGRAPQLFRDDLNFKNYIITKMCMQCISLAAPFYMLYAKDILNVSPKMQGVFTSAIGISGAIALLFWAYIADNYGNRLLMQISSVTTVLAPLLAVLTQFTPTDSLIINAILNKVRYLTSSDLALHNVYLFVFVLIGASRFGLWVSSTNYLLEIAPSEQRVTYIGLSNSISAPFILMPMLGGYIISLFSYEACFITSMTFGLITFYLTLGLDEPRK